MILHIQSQTEKELKEIHKPTNNLVNYFQQSRNLMRFLLVATLLLTTFIVYYYKTRDLELLIADRGWSPHDYVAHKINPENFQKDNYQKRSVKIGMSH